MGAYMKYLIFILLLVSGSAFAHESHDAPAPNPPVTTTNTTTTLTLPSGSTYGLLALASSGLVYDWGTPDKLQVSFAGAFTEGGNQSFAVGVGTRFGGILVNASFVTTLSAPENEDDYAVIVGGTIRF